MEKNQNTSLLKKVSFLTSGLFICIFLSPVNAQENSFPSIASGDELGHQHGSHVECPLPQRAADVVECAQKRHLAVQRARLALLSADRLEEVARQIPNPEFETKTIFGDSQGSKQVQSENSFMQAIDLWGKRSSKVKEAKAKKRRLETKVRHVQADVIVETVLNLHRLRQLDQEIAILKNTTGAYKEIISQMKTRQFLNPDQEVALGVYEMALSEIQFKTTSLLDEEREIEHYFHVNTGHGIDEIRRVVPTSPSAWPTLEKNAKTSLSPRVNEHLADEEIARVQLELSQADSWPELKLGPVIVFNSQGSNNQQLYGGQLSLPLPLFQTNAGGRAYAKSELTRSEKATALLKAEEAHERAEHFKAYQSSIKALQQTLSGPEIDKRFKAMKSLRQRGLISSPLVVEAYRQRYDAYVNHNFRELMALKSLWTIYKLDGKIFKETL